MIRRKDEENDLIFAVFDKCLYFREIVFFYDKVSMILKNLT